MEKIWTVIIPLIVAFLVFIAFGASLKAYYKQGYRQGQIDTLTRIIKIEFVNASDNSQNWK